MIKFLKKRYKLIISLAVIAGLVIFFTNRSSVQRKNEKEVTAKVKSGKLEEILTISGAIDAEEKITLRFQTSGRLAWVGVKEGDYVKKYQGIASLDKREVEKNLKKKLLAYMNERWDFEQLHYDNLVLGRPISKVGELTIEERTILEQAQFDLESSVLDLEIQTLAAEYANLWTPIAGIVTKVAAPFAGMNITPATAEFEIINPSTVYFSATADETEVTKLKESLAGKLVLDAFPDDKLTGVIDKISFTPKSGESGTVYEVKFKFTNLHGTDNYRIGMAGDVDFVTGSINKAVYIPTKFIQEEKAKTYVFVKRQVKNEKVQVKTAEEINGDTVILSGLKVNETVVLPGK